VVSLRTLAGRLALFVGGHVVALGLVIVLSMSAGPAVSDSAPAASALAQTVAER
jgi:hypothetical protein